MLRRAWVAVVLVLGGLAAPASAQEGQGTTKLQWKFKAGEKFYLEDVSTMKITGSFGDKDIKQTQKTTLVTSYEIREVTEVLRSGWITTGPARSSSRRTLPPT